MELKRIAEGLTVVAVGLIFLGNTLGLIPWSVWWNIISLWPLLLIAAGIDIIGRGIGNTWVRALSSVLVITGLAYGVFVMPTSGASWGPWDPFARVPATSTANAGPFERSRPHDPGVKTGKAQVSGGVGTLTVTDGTSLVSASGESPLRPVFDASVSGSRADVTVGMGNGQWVAPRDHARLDVKLDRAVAWDLAIDAGVSQIDADLSQLSLSVLEVKAGVSKGTLTLGAVDRAVASGGVPVKLDTGISDFTLRIKNGEAVRLRVDRGLSTIDVPVGFESSGDDAGKQTYTTRGFSQAHGFWDITLDAGVSHVRVESYEEA